jgi:thioredoxin-related protein
MKTKILKSGLIVLLSIFSFAGFGQEAKKIYDPSLDGMKQINAAVAAAKASGKHVLIQYGGNWCPWCIKFDGFSKADPEISKMIADNFIPVKLNYSPENRNSAANEYLGYPSRFGFPVFIIVNGKGKVLHIQDSGLLEEGEGYNQKKVVGFLRNWTASAITFPYTIAPAKTKAEVEQVKK